MTKYGFLMLVLLTLGACGNHVKTAIRQPAEHDDSALLYVYRPASMSNLLISPRLLVDDSEAFPIKNDHYTYVKLMPGDHRVELLVSERYTGRHRLEFAALAGQVYYLRVGTHMAFRKNDLYARRFDLQPVDAETAVDELGACRYFSIKAEKDSEDSQPSVGTASDSDDSEFSISKSRDPFSRKK